MTAGTRLGPYEILAPLGAGGMGEVYRARDTRLDRDVAIKVLPQRLAGDAPARARFEREARAVAALSHPNILAIHDVGDQDGVVYAVTELLAGETLRDRLQGGALPLRKTVQIGGEIANGLAAAHDKGIVHRDLKPENVFLAADGHVKILDFGLARQTAAPESASDAHTQIAQTDPGTVLGTVGYMSPEQVRGESADHRADIFSLGCVLYEMAAGRRPFAGATAAETMTAILREDPPEVTRDAAGMNAALEHVVRHCLEKRPEERYQSARDLAFALRSLQGSTRSGVHAGAAPPPARRRSFLPIVAAAALGAAAAFFAGRYTGGRAALAGAPITMSFAQITDLPGVETTPLLTPDGKSVIYAKTLGDDSALYLLRIGARTPVRLSGPAPASDRQPALSPDGERIAFRSERDGGGVFLMSAGGESVTRLTDFGYWPSWSPDGTQVVVSPATFSAPTDLGSVEQGVSIVTVQSRQRRDVPVSGRVLQPAWSPSGARIAYFSTRGETGQRDIWTVAADGSDAASGGVTVTSDPALDWSPTWAPDGRSLYFASTRGGTMNIWRVAIDERSGRPLGEPEPMTTPSSWSGHLSLSPDGKRFAYAGLDYRSTLWRAPFDAARGAIAGPPVPMVKGTRPIRDHELSPDGEWIAFTEAGVREDLFVARTDGTQYRRLTDDSFRDRGPAWSPDGARIAFYTDRGGTYDLWTIRADGIGLAPLTQRIGVPGFPVWSPDGKRLAFGFGTWFLLDAARTPDSPPPVPEPLGPLEFFMPTSWTANGERVAGLVRSSREPAMVAVHTLATQQFATVPGPLARSDFWLMPMWLADGRRLVIRRPEGIAIVDADTGAGHVLTSVGGYMVGRTVGLSRDNKWITYSETATEGDIWIATTSTAARER